jgi:hypothetical protein
MSLIGQRRPWPSAKTLPRRTPAAGLPQTKVEFTGPTAELDFLNCKTVPFFYARNGERLAPLAIEDRPPTAGTVGMRAMTLPSSQTRK